LLLDEPLSFWGGVDETTGEIIDRRHPQAGETVTGTILVLPAGRGSSSSSSVLTETLRRGTGPAGIVLARPDHILAIGALIAGELYGRSCPVVVAAPDVFSSVSKARRAEISDARVTPTG
jgi:predicted aconitase with swiveling domain